MLAVQNLISQWSGFLTAGLLWRLEAWQGGAEPPLYLVYLLKPVHQFAPKCRVEENNRRWLQKKQYKHRS